MAIEKPYKCMATSRVLHGFDTKILDWKVSKGWFWCVASLGPAYWGIVKQQKTSCSWSWECFTASTTMKLQSYNLLATIHKVMCKENIILHSYLAIYKTDTSILLHLFWLLVLSLRCNHSFNFVSKVRKFRLSKNFNKCAPGLRLHTFPLQPPWQDFQAHFFDLAFLFSNRFNFGPIFIIQQEDGKSFVGCAYPLKDIDFSTLPWKAQQQRQRWFTIRICW